MYYAPTRILTSLLKMAKSFFLSLLVLFLAALMFSPQHFAVDAAFGPIFKTIPKIAKKLPKIAKKPPKPPKINSCSKIPGKDRSKDCPPATHF